MISGFCFSAKLKKVAQKKPEFILKPKPINKGSNQKTMMFEVITDGNPEPLYNWYFNDEEVRQLRETKNTFRT